MIEVRLGDRYAKSIMQLAIERKELEPVKQDFDLIQSVCNENPAFTRMLKSPLIGQDKKQAIIDQVFGKNFSPITQNLVEIIIRKKREAYLLDIAVRFLHAYDIEKNITRGLLTSSRPMSPAQVAKIKGVVEDELKTSFIMEESIDPELIGGFVLKVGDFLYDGSISAGLRKLKQEFEKNPYVKLT